MLLEEREKQRYNGGSKDEMGVEGHQKKEWRCVGVHNKLVSSLFPDSKSVQLRFRKTTKRIRGQ